VPIHDWTRVDAGLFHDFHQDWTIELRRSLNAGRLPPGYVALTDQQIGGPIPEVLTLRRGPKSVEPPETAGGTAVATVPSRARFVVELEEDIYIRRANRIVIQHRHGEVVAVIEIVSPGNKNNRTGLRAFVRKAADLIWQGINLLVVDLFPPSDRDPQGIPKAILEEIGGISPDLPADKLLTVSAYQAAPVKKAYVEPMAVGDDLPEMPIFLLDGQYVLAPLEETYRASWAAYPAAFKELLEMPSM
jgi:hypothetical protein